MTQAEILSIEEYSKHKATHKQRPTEPEIPFCNFYRSKRKYHIQNETPETSG